MSLLKYLRAAFANRWNLLSLFAGTGVAIISGRPDIVMPLVAAGEVAYLGFASTNPRFQTYVDVTESGALQQQRAVSTQQALAHMTNALPKDAKDRFDRLRGRCVELRQIANDLRQPGTTTGPLDSLQNAGLDRLLWIFLRLLFTQFSLGRFLERTTRREIEAELKQVEERLATVPQTADKPHDEKMRRTLQDHVQTSRERLDNFDKARANYELVGLELDRLENKITSLAELAVNRQEPDFIAGQVNQVADSMRDTERTMNELEFATGLGPLQEEVPALLPPVTVRF